MFDFGNQKTLAVSTAEIKGLFQSHVGSINKVGILYCPFPSQF